MPATSVGIAAPRLASTAPPSGAAFASTLPNPLQAAPPPTQQATVSNEQPPPPAEPEPFGFADFTWLNGNSRETEFPLQGKYFTGEVYADAQLHATA